MLKKKTQAPALKHSPGRAAPQKASPSQSPSQRSEPRRRLQTLSAAGLFWQPPRGSVSRPRSQLPLCREGEEENALPEGGERHVLVTPARAASVLLAPDEQIPCRQLVPQPSTERYRQGD